ncbi:hypothetical protein VZT92_014409 [Zoarces viviparus]|uniref:Uncharacterized protein n=1 Tax=Zoarces viviparus TaxID=48416 RepID=A0AAW1EZZ9_ZOAVI
MLCTAGSLTSGFATVNSSYTQPISWQPPRIWPLVYSFHQAEEKEERELQCGMIKPLDFSHWEDMDSTPSYLSNFTRETSRAD